MGVRKRNMGLGLDITHGSRDTSHAQPSNWRDPMYISWISKTTKPININKPITAFCKRSFSYLAPTVCNGLAFNIGLSPTFDTFKRRLKTHLFN